MSGSARPAKKLTTKTKRAPAAPADKPVGVASQVDVEAVVATLRRLATKGTRDGMARYGIPSDNALGVTVGALHWVAKDVGRNHELAAALWSTGIYEARMLAAFVDEPARITAAQMDQWAGEFDSWAICDTICFHLFDRTPHAFKKVGQWARREDEFVKRAAFALLASVALHDKNVPEQPFLDSLPLIERAADDARNFVKKGVLWALRGIGGRSSALHAAAMAQAGRLAASPVASARWIGKAAQRELGSSAAQKRLAKQRASARPQ